MVLQRSNAIQKQQAQRLSAPQDDEVDDGAENEGDSEEARVHLRSSTFDELIVWGHEVVPDDLENPYVKGVEEWMAFAQAVSTALPQPGCIH